VEDTDKKLKIRSSKLYSTVDEAQKASELFVHSHDFEKFKFLPIVITEE